MELGSKDPSSHKLSALASTDVRIKKHIVRKCFTEEDMYHSKSTHFSRRYDVYVYGSIDMAEKKLRSEMDRSPSLKLLKRHARRCLKKFKQRQIFINAFHGIDRKLFPWISDSIKSSPKDFTVGESVESAEHGEVGEACPITSLYPGGCASITTSKGPKLCHLKLTRRFSVLSESAGSQTANQVVETNSPQTVFIEGDLVEVARRAWIGINKPGGVGKITKVYRDEIGIYDVKYTLGGRERRVDSKFITHYSFMDRHTDKRDTMGRCRRPGCNSFIRDCKHTQPGQGLDNLVIKINEVKEKRIKRLKENSDISCGNNVFNAAGEGRRHDSNGPQALCALSHLQAGSTVSSLVETKKLRKVLPKLRVIRSSDEDIVLNSYNQVPSAEPVVIPQRFQKTFRRSAREMQRGANSRAIEVGVSNVPIANRVERDIFDSDSDSSVEDIPALRPGNQNIMVATDSFDFVDSDVDVLDDEEVKLDREIDKTATGSRIECVLPHKRTSSEANPLKMLKERKNELPQPQDRSFRRANSIECSVREETLQTCTDHAVGAVRLNPEENNGDSDALIQVFNSAVNDLEFSFRHIDGMENPRLLLLILEKANSKLKDLIKHTKTKLSLTLNDISSKMESTGQFTSAFITRQVLSLSTDLDDGRLEAERASNNVFDHAYLRLRKFKASMSSKERAKRKALDLENQPLRESWKSVVHDLKNKIQRLHEKFNKCFGFPINFDILTNEPLGREALENSSDGEWLDESSDSRKRHSRDKSYSDRNCEPYTERRLPSSHRRKRARVEEGRGSSRKTSVKGDIDFIDNGEAVINVQDYFLCDFLAEDSNNGIEEQKIANFYENKYKKSCLLSEEDGDTILLIDEVDNVPSVTTSALKAPQKIITAFISFACNISVGDEKVILKEHDLVRRNWKEWASSINRIQSALNGADTTAKISEKYTSIIYKLYGSERLYRSKKDSFWEHNSDLNDLDGDRDSRRAWSALSDQLLHRFLSDLSTYPASSDNWNFDENCSEESQSGFSNTWQILNMLKSLFEIYVNAEQDVITGDGDSPGQVDSFLKSCLSFEAFFVDRISSFHDAANAERLYLASCLKFLKYLSFKLQFIRMLTKNPVMAFTFEGIINGMQAMLRHETNSPDNVGVELTSDAVGMALIMFWFQLVSDNSAHGGSSYAAKSQSAWNDVTFSTLSWIRTSYPTLSIAMNWSMYHIGNVTRTPLLDTEDSCEDFNIGVKLKPSQCRSVNAHVTLWVVVILHTMALKLIAGDGRIGANWGIIRLLFINIPEGPTLSEWREYEWDFLKRATCLSSVWDGATEAFDLWIDMCSDMCLEALQSLSVSNPIDVTQGLCKALLNGYNGESNVIQKIIEYCYVAHHYSSDLENKDSYPYRLNRMCGWFGLFLKASLDGTSAVVKKRLTNKLCAHSGILSFQSRNEFANKTVSVIVMMDFIDEAIRCLGASNILIDGTVDKEILALISNKFSVNSEQPSDDLATKNCDFRFVLSHLAVKLSVAWILDVNRNPEEDRAVISFHCTVLKIYFQQFQAWIAEDAAINGTLVNTVNVFPIALSILFPIIDFLWRHSFLVSDEMELGSMLFRQVVNVLSFILNRNFGTSLDLFFSASVRICWEMIDLFSNDSTWSTKLSPSAQRARQNAIDEVNRSLFPAIKGTVLLLVDSINDTSFDLSKKTSDSLAICIDAIMCMSQLCVASFICDSCTGDSSLKQLFATGSLKSKMVIFQVLKSPLFLKIEAIDTALTRLSGCEDSVINQWFKCLFWVPILNYLRLNPRHRDFSIVLFLHHIQSIVQAWMTCYVTLHLVPDAVKDFSFNTFNILFRDIVLDAQVWRKGFIENHITVVPSVDAFSPTKLILLESMVHAIDDLSNYNRSDQTPGSTFFFTELMLDKNGRDAALVLYTVFAAIVRRTFELQKLQNSTSLHAFRKENIQIALCIEKCIRYIKIRSLDASIRRSEELLEFAHIIIAILVGNLSFSSVPEGLENIYRDVLAPAAVELQRSIDKGLLSESMSNMVHGYNVSIPINMRFILKFLPFYISGTSFMKFSTMFLEWKYIVQFAVIGVDGSGRDRIIDALAQSLVESRELSYGSMRKELEDGCGVSVLGGLSNYSIGIFQNFDSKLAVFRQFLVTNEDIWLQICSSLKMMPSSPSSMIGIVRTRIVGKIILKLSAGMGLWSLIRSTNRGDNERGVEIVSIENWKSEILVFLIVSSTAAMQLLRCFLCHPIVDVSRLRSGVEASKELTEYVLVLFSGMNLFFVWTDRFPGSTSTLKLLFYHFASLMSLLLEMMSYTLEVKDTCGNSTDDANHLKDLCSVFAVTDALISSLCRCRDEMTKDSHAYTVPEGLMSEFRRNYSAVAGVKDLVTQFLIGQKAQSNLKAYLRSAINSFRLKHSIFENKDDMLSFSDNVIRSAIIACKSYIVNDS